LQVAEMGAVPLIPHTNTAFFAGELSDEFWLDATQELLERCDGILMIPGWQFSDGAIEEREVARAFGMEVFYVDNLNWEAQLGRWIAEKGKA